MKPGASARPPASRRSRAAWPALPLTSTMRPPLTATLPWRAGAPVPSTIRALSITRSCMEILRSGWNHEARTTSRAGGRADGDDDRRAAHGDAQAQIPRPVRAHPHLGAVLPGERRGIEDDLDQPPVGHPPLQPDVGAGEGGAGGVPERDDVVAELAACVVPR